MNDVFNEQIIKKKSGNKDIVYKTLIIVAAILLLYGCLFSAVLTSFMLPIIAIEVILIVFLFRRFNIEYEYILTNTTLDVDKIINKSKRKSIISVDVKSFEIMVPVIKNEYKNEVSNYNQLLNLSSGEVKENTYAVIFAKNSKKYKMIFEPNEKIFKAIKMYIPSKIKK